MNCPWCDADGRQGCPTHYRRQRRWLLAAAALLTLLAVIATIRA